MSNVGGLDRTVRAVLGLLLLASPLLVGGVWTYVLPLIGVVLLGTASMRFCPAYRLLGVSTCSINTRADSH